MDGAFRIRNVLCESYLVDPNEFDTLKYGHVDARLPVLRMFGITDGGTLAGGLAKLA